MSFTRRYSLSVRQIVLGTLITTGFGIFAGYLFISISESSTRICKGKYSRINEDVVCGGHIVIDKKSYTTLRNDILLYTNVAKEAGKITEVALYFRDLNNGPIFGINELANFSPASLLKLPFAIAAFDMEEEEGGLLERQILYKQIAPVLEQTIKPRTIPKENRPYSVETLLLNTLVYSDNVSYEILVEYLNSLPDGSKKIINTFQNIGILDPRHDTEETLSVRGYASLFRLLYNVSYLDAEHSEKILSWLAQADFKGGLKAGVPDNIVVAHKFGEREWQDGGYFKQFHDCGIVYFPRNPYLLCVMTRGHDTNTLIDVVQTISRMVYEEVKSRRF